MTSAGTDHWTGKSAQEVMIRIMQIEMTMKILTIKVCFNCPKTVNPAVPIKTINPLKQICTFLGHLSMKILPGMDEIMKIPVTAAANP